MQHNKQIMAVSIGLFTAVLIYPWLNRPFTGHHDFVGAFDSQMARNYLRYGLIATKFGQVTNFGIATPAEFAYHTHHPPGIILYLAGIFSLFGEHEVVARAAFAIFAVGSIILLFLLAAEATTPSVGFATALFTAITPMFVYPSILPVYESPALFLILLQFWGFERWKQSHQLSIKRIYGTIIIFSALLGNITAWATYFAVPLLLIQNLVSKRKDKTVLKFLFLLQLSAIIIFSLHLTHTKVLTGGWLGGGLGEVVLRRSIGVGEQDQRYVLDNQKYLAKIVARIKNFYGWPLLLTALIGIGISVFKRSVSQRKLLYLLGGTALALPVVFRNYVYVHDYTLYYTAPLIGFAAAICLKELTMLLKTQAHLSEQSFGMLFAGLVTTLVLATFVFTRETTTELRESIDWYLPSQIIGQRLRQTTQPGQSILLINQLLREQEMQLAYYADRPVSFLPTDTGNAIDIGNTDVIVIVTSDQTFVPEVKTELLKRFRLEVDQGIEYYYRK